MTSNYKSRRREKPDTEAVKRVRATSPFFAADDLSPSVRSALQALPAPHDGVLEIVDLPVIVPGVRFELSTEQLAQAQAIFRDLFKHEIKPYADNSRKSIRADWRHWIAFCANHDRLCMPVQFDDLVEFLSALIDAGYKRASLEHLLFTLKLASRLWGCPCPTETAQFRWYWQQQCREKLTSRKHQASALNIETVDHVMEAITTPSGLDSLLELRDKVYVAVAYDLLGRASEMVRLQWNDVRFDADADDGATCTISRSKTDQQGAGVALYLTPRSAALLLTWQKQRSKATNYLWPAVHDEYQQNSYIFHRLPRYRLFEPSPAANAKRLRWDTHLSVREADRIIKRAAGNQYSAHSARVGAAQDMTRAGMDLPAIMQQGRWNTPTMPARYAENELATRAGKSRQKALAKLRDH
ncbi:tyrosine-type recombinase/integrase [Xanthomonas phaseoli pv. phaseoli]|uniref:Phage integrase family protein n=1 Tax=Xanthomonas campestris pv. phaseoli TaxID=317013 RepID=A0AB38DU42_XANCH|nr:tyrosine-type recombinase/integrase [Xanthomonas phaseoli]ATS23165.1 tyrosine-type recombinase/integrase [Xanthomonas phaseoli pv. phaseoli]ATS34320.1 tyrosine-type recombinase/integrase [Xanthomonas phaseoli pv. phaseoli]UZB16428.1 tyrosine-type recombinase/integrase [Xanthomonas phaseoli pv. phaseoli]UZB20578.1 tyrosine-type recombinase/integrase [Xanthomonas phaseoli pv. phaseoli]SON76559.1 Phage integrase family protein [Xanthomonas phaseoli pv. phaseoli]